MIIIYAKRKYKQKTYDFFVNDWGGNLYKFVIDEGIKIRRPPTIFSVCSGVYSVPYGADVGVAAVA